MITAEQALARVEEIHCEMMEQPARIPELRLERDEVLAVVAAAEAAERELVPTLEERWQFYCECRLLGRRRMSPRSKEGDSVVWRAGIQELAAVSAKVNGNGSVVNAETYHQRGKEVADTLERLRAERDQLDYAIERWEQRRAPPARPSRYRVRSRRHMLIVGAPEPAERLPGRRRAR